MPRIGAGVRIENLAQIAGVAPQMDDTDKMAMSAYGKASAAGDTPILVDSSGRPLVDVKLIAGVAPQLDDTDKIAMSAYGKASAAGDTPILLKSNGTVLVEHNVAQTTLGDGASNLPAVIRNSDGYTTTGIAFPFLCNGTTWDRKRNNEEKTVLASAARTATTNSADQVNYNHRGLILVVNVTARAVGTTLTPNLQVKDPIGGDYKTIWTAAAAINTADGSFFYLFYPSALADAAELYTEAVDLTLGRTWRVSVTHGDANSITYSVAAAMIL